MLFVIPASILFDHLRFSAYVVMIREWGRNRLFTKKAQFLVDCAFSVGRIFSYAFADLAFNFCMSGISPPPMELPIVIATSALSIVIEKSPASEK